VYQSAEPDDALLAVWDATSKQIVSKSIQEVDWGKSSTIAKKAEVLRMHFKLLRWVFGQFGCDPPSSCDCGCGQKHGHKRGARSTQPGAKPAAKPRRTKKRAKAKVAEAAIHTGIECDNCSVTPIRGLRHTCGICQDYDLCNQCEKEGSHGHDEDHPLIEVPNPELLEAADPGKPDKVVLDAVAAKAASTKMLAEAKLELQEARRLQAQTERMKLKAAEQEEAEKKEMEEAEEKEQKAADKLAKKLEAKARRKAQKEKSDKEEAARKGLVDTGVKSDSEDDESTAGEEDVPTTKGAKKRKPRRRDSLEIELLKRELRLHKEMSEITYQHNLTAAISRNFAYNPN
jgi:hypothetical protein